MLEDSRSFPCSGAWGSSVGGRLVGVLRGWVNWIKASLNLGGWETSCETSNHGATNLPVVEL